MLAYEKYLDRVTYEDLYLDYVIARLTKAQIKEKYSIKTGKIVSQLLRHYNIKNKVCYKEAEEQYNSLQLDLVIDYYINDYHTVQLSADHFNVTSVLFIKFLRNNNLVKSHDMVYNGRNKIHPCYNLNKPQYLLDKLLLEEYYINLDHTIEECMKYFNLSKSAIYWNIRIHGLRKVKNFLMDFEATVSEEEFKLYYIKENHSVPECIEHFNSSRKVILEYIAKYNLRKPEDLVTQCRARCNLTKYGVTSPSALPEIRDKITLSRYLNNGQYKTKQAYQYIAGINFDSSWELAYYIYCKDMGYNIERCPQRFSFLLEGITHYYTVDFSVNNQLVEIKGNHFFDESGTLIDPFAKDSDESQRLAAEKQKVARENGVIFYTYDDLKPIILAVQETYTRDFIPLFKTHLEFPYHKLKSITFDDIIRYFHKSIFDANVNGYVSPLAAWNNKDLVYKSALNRLKYVGSCKPEDIVRGFSVAKIAPKVSVFKASLAKRLILNYLSDATTIFDPFSGFSGRMLGAISNNIPYIGLDINQKHVAESNEILLYLGNSTCKVSQTDIFESSGDYDCLFTCPPYGNKEHWNDSDINLSCDLWVQECLKRFKCRKYLFVVDNTDMFKDNIVEVITNKSHFGSNSEFVILIERTNA